MAKAKHWYKYHLKRGGKVIFRGITNDLARRQQGHQAHFPGTTIVQIGRCTTYEAALRWEREGGKRAYQRDRYLELDTRLPATQECVCPHC